MPPAPLGWLPPNRQTATGLGEGAESLAASSVGRPRSTVRRLVGKLNVGRRPRHQQFPSEACRRMKTTTRTHNTRTHTLVHTCGSDAPSRRKARNAPSARGRRSGRAGCGAPERRSTRPPRGGARSASRHGRRALRVLPRSQAPKRTFPTIPFIMPCLEKRSLWGRKADRWWSEAGGAGEEVGVTARGYGVSFWGVENALELEVTVCNTFKGSIIW